MSKVAVLRGQNTMPLQAMLDRPVAYHSAFAKLGAGATGALMLSQAVYWSSRTNDSEGWFYKSQVEWEAETGLTRTEQEKARRALKSAGFLEEARKGLPAKLYYRVNLDAVAAALGGRMKPVSLDEVLDIYKAALNSLSKTGYMRAVKAGVKAEKVDYAEVLRVKGMVCGCCGEVITKGPGQSSDSLAFDHKMPIAKGGDHTPDNLQPTHFKCNAIKGSFVEAIKFASTKQTSPLNQVDHAGFAETDITENTTETTSDSAQAGVADIFEGSSYRPMTLGWKPDQKALKSYAFAQGVNVSLFTPELIAAFTCHHSAHPETHDTAAGWTNKLVGWARRERVRTEAKPAPIAAPYQQIVDLYHECCPRFSVVTVLDAKIQGLIAERWVEHPVHQDLSFWADYFEEAAKLCEVFYRGMKRLPFLEALVSRDVFRDVMEGRANA